MRRSEALVKAIIESLLPDCTMAYVADQSVSRPDFYLTLSDGSRWPLEVTRATSPGYLETKNATLSERHGGPCIPRVHCQRDWTITACVGADISRIRKDADMSLAAIEARGLERFSIHTDCHAYPEVEDIFRRLRVETGEVTRFQVPGIGIVLPPQGGKIKADLVADVVAAECLKPDNVRKLQPAGHLAIILDTSIRHAWLCMNAAKDLPTGSLRTPDPLRQVWVICSTEVPRTYRVWVFTTADGWRDLGCTGLSEESMSTVMSSDA